MKGTWIVTFDFPYTRCCFFVYLFFCFFSCYDRGAPLFFFFSKVSQFGSLRHVLTPTNLICGEEKKTNCYQVHRMKKSHGLARYTTRVMKKRKWTKIPTILGQGAPSFRKRYRQKEVYLNMAYLRRFWVKEPRHSKNVIARKRYTLIWRIFRRFWVKEPRHSETISQTKKGIPLSCHASRGRDDRGLVFFFSVGRIASLVACTR